MPTSDTKVSDASGGVEGESLELVAVGGSGGGEVVADSSWWGVLGVSDGAEGSIEGAASTRHAKEDAVVEMDMDRAGEQRT